MKHLQSFESKKKKGLLKFINYKDTENWDPKQVEKKEAEKKLTGKKKLDTNLGQKVIDLLAEYRLFVTVGSGNWIKDQHLLLPDEKKLKEYRVQLGKKQTFDDWLDWEFGGKPDDKTDEELREEYKNVEVDYEDAPEWSVFLPVGTKNIEASAMADSSIYLKLISSAYPEVLEGSLIEQRYGGALSDSPDGFKEFINAKGVNITNKNVEIVDMINTRLYKDSKVFYEFEYHIFDGKYETKEFFQKWLKLIK